MHRTLIALLVALGPLVPPQDAHAKKTPAVYAKAIHRDGTRALAEIFQSELASAKARHKAVVVMFTADWCTPCKVIKVFVQESPAVQRKVAGGHLLYIDVDEWRGPAHRLIPGVNPTRLPTLVNVDYQGKRVQQCYGTDLGLLSGEAIGHNLKRLLVGKLPEKPKYLDDPELKRALIRQQAQRQKQKTVGLPPVEVAVRAVQGESWRVRVVLRNNEAPRRWYIVPDDLDGEIGESPAVAGWDLLHFTEHYRAQAMRFRGQPGFHAIPVAGHGYVVLDNWIVRGPESGGTLTILELNRMTLGGSQVRFDKKVPYELDLQDARKIRVLRRTDTPVALELKVRERHPIALDP